MHTDNGTNKPLSVTSPQTTPMTNSNLNELRDGYLYMYETPQGHSIKTGLVELNGQLKAPFITCVGLTNKQKTEVYLELIPELILSRFVMLADESDKQTKWLDKQSHTARPIKTDDLLRSLGAPPPLWGKLKTLLNNQAVDIVHGTQFLPYEYGCGSSESNIAIAEGFQWFNTYRPPLLNPIYDAKDLGNFHELLHVICGGDRDVIRHLTEWLAHIVRYPNIKLMHGVVLSSENQGIGKSTLAHDIMKRLLGEQHVNSVKLSDVVNGKQDWIKDRLLVVVEEVKDASTKTMNDLKAYITEEDIQLDLKYSKYYQGKNYANFIFTTNEKLSLRIDEHDRRYFVVNSSLKANPELHDRLRAWLEHDDGYAKVLGYLLEVDLSDFKPHGNPPMTDAKKMLIQNSKSNFEGWLEDWLEEAPDVFLMSDLEDAMEHSPYASERKNTRNIRRLLERNNCKWELNASGKPLRKALNKQRVYPVYKAERYQELVQKQLRDVLTDKTEDKDFGF